MRKQTYPGIKLGAHIIDKQRGGKVTVQVGTVDRNPPEHATWLYRFAPTRTFDGAAAKGFAERLGNLRAFAFKHDWPAEALAASIDQLVEVYL